jgi:hypothetical protein
MWGNFMKKLAQVRVIVVLLFAFVLVSCGDGGADDTTTTQSNDVEETTTTTAAPEADDDDEGGSLEGFSSTCLEATQGMAAAVSAYSSGMTQAFGGSLDEESLQLAADQLDAMAEAAPDEIKDDFAVIATELGVFYDALVEMGYEPGATPDADQLAELSALAETFNTDAFEEAGDNINAWFEENC